MFFVANFHKMAFSIVLSLLLLNEFPNHLLQAVHFLNPEVISLSARREPPSPSSQTLTLQATVAAATKTSTHCSVISNQGANQAHLLRLPGAEPGPQKPSTTPSPPPMTKKCAHSKGWTDGTHVDHQMSNHHQPPLLTNRGCPEVSPLSSCRHTGEDREKNMGISL